MSATATTHVGGPGRIGPNVFTAASAPTADNDSTVGHMVGDVIIVGSAIYQATDVTATAAVWRAVNGAEAPVDGDVTERVISEVNLGNGSVLRRAYIEEAKVFSAAATASLTTQLPALARVIAASLNLDTAVVLSTAVKLGLGTAGDPDGFALSSTTVTKNTKTDNVAPTVASVAAATTVVITACDTSGAAAGTVTSGTVRARVVYEYVTSIGNAA